MSIPFREIGFVVMAAMITTFQALLVFLLFLPGFVSQRVQAQTFILRISTGFSIDRRAAKTADSVCVLSRRIIPNTKKPRSANAARTCATTMSRFILLSSWIEVLVTGAGVDSDSSKP